MTQLVSRESKVQVANVSMENVLDFSESKVQPITLAQLERTHKENDVYGNPLKGIYHYELINDVVGMCREFGYDVDIYDMFAAQNKDRSTPGVVVLPQVEAQFGKNAVEAHVLRRVFANIRIKDFDDAENTTNLAIAFHQRGIQVGFGNMVKVCHNQCMLGADRYVATYNDRGRGRQVTPSIDELKEIIRGWLLEAKTIVVTEREKMERMRAITVEPEALYALIGCLTVIRVKCDSQDKSIREAMVYPLSQTQINAFTEALLIRYATEERVSVWDIYNAATEMYKASGMDIPQVLPQNRAMVEFLDERFGL